MTVVDWIVVAVLIAPIAFFWLEGVAWMAPTWVLVLGAGWFALAWPVTVPVLGFAFAWERLRHG